MKWKDIMRIEIRYFFLEISNLIIYFHFLTEWWSTHSNVLA